MEFSAAEIRDLASFFAKRFPSAADRERLSRAAGIDSSVGAGAPDAKAAWVRVIGHAVDKGRLARLVKAARATDPSDENLQELGLILAPPANRAPLFLASAAAAALFVGVVGIGLVASFLDDEPEPTAVAGLVDSGTPRPDLVSTVPPASGAASGGTANAAPSPPPAPSAEVSSDAVAAAAVDDATNAPEVAPEAPSSSRRAAGERAEVRPANKNGRCTSEPGEVVGYWYAGREAPGSAGQTITMGKSVNVRSDYPDAHNSYDARSPVRCVLKAGDELRLSQDPLEVPGGAYWVPLVTGDLNG